MTAESFYLVLTDWLPEDAYGPEGYGTDHIALIPYAPISVCGRLGEAVEVFVEFVDLSDNNDRLCEACREFALAAIDNIARFN